MICVNFTGKNSYPAHDAACFEKFRAAKVTLSLFECSASYIIQLKGGEYNEQTILRSAASISSAPAPDPRRSCRRIPLLSLCRLRYRYLRHNVQPLYLYRIRRCHGSADRHNRKPRRTEKRRIARLPFPVTAAPAMLKTRHIPGADHSPWNFFGSGITLCNIRTLLPEYAVNVIVAFYLYILHNLSPAKRRLAPNGIDIIY